MIQALERNSILSSTYFVISLLFVGLFYRFVFIFQDLKFLSDYWLFEDFGYVLAIAKHMAYGNGWTTDGVILTNGFQPLYVWLVSPFYLLFPNDVVLPLYSSLVFLAIFNVATGFLLYKLIFYFTKNQGLSILGLGIWLFNPVFARTGTNGLETGLVVFFVALAVYFYIFHVRFHNSIKNFFVFGIILGLMFLSRIDTIIIISIFVIDMLGLWYFERKKSILPLKKLSKIFLISILSFAIVVTPYVAYNHYTFDTLLPTVTKVTQSSKDNLSDFSYSFDNIVYVILSGFSGEMKSNSQVYGLNDTPLKIFELESYSIPILFFIVILLGILYYFFFAHRSYNKKFLYLGIIIFFIIYISVYAQNSKWETERYYFSLSFFTTFLFCIISHYSIKKQNKIKFVVIAIVLGLSISYILNVNDSFAENYISPGYYDGIVWMNENLDTSNDVVAGLESGNIGYFYNGRTINLDGVVNMDAYDARKAQRMDNYVSENQIDYIAGKSMNPHYFITHWGFTDMQSNVWKTKMDLVHVVNSTNPFLIYHLDYNINYEEIYNLDENLFPDEPDWEILTGYLWPHTLDYTHIDNDIMMSSQKNGKITFASEHDCVDVLFTTNRWSGFANIYVDQELYQTVDLYSKVNNPTFKVNIQNTNPFDLTIEVDGKKNKHSKDNQVWIDAILVC